MTGKRNNLEPVSLESDRSRSKSQLRDWVAAEKMKEEIADPGIPET